MLEVKKIKKTQDENPDGLSIRLSYNFTSEITICPANAWSGTSGSYTKYKDNAIEEALYNLHNKIYGDLLDPVRELINLAIKTSDYKDRFRAEQVAADVIKILQIKD